MIGTTGECEKEGGAGCQATQAPVFADFPLAEEDQSIPQRFSKISRKYADQLAIKDGDTSLTFAELDRITSRLARGVLDNAKAVELPIAFCLSHGIAPVIAILAILKAGKFYLPLDPSFPPSRLAYFLQDSEAQLILTDQENFQFAKEISGAKLPLVDLGQVSESYPAEGLDPDIHPDHFANLLYTSGSSGMPKGVPQTHRNLLHSVYVLTKNNQYRLDDRLSLLFSTSFAASTNPILGALLNGLALFPFDSKRNLAGMAEWINQERITVISAVPTLLRHFGSLVVGKERFPSVRLVTMGGETVLKSDLELLRRVFPEDCQLRVGLGGSEMLVLTSIAFEGTLDLADSVIPVGYANDGMEIFLFDENGKQVDIGQPGEIVVRSRYLSPGYWHRPEITELKFKTDPAGDGLRIYYTGDLGRVRADGCLFHLGRKDFQVKIRGFRVELEEIDSALSEHPGIAEAAVGVDDRGTHEKRLVAYYTPSNEYPAPSHEEMRLFLRKKLPDYMIPFAFVSMEALPLTPSGKIDRLALPSLEEVLHLENDFVPPRNEVEAKLVQIWEELLEVSPIGIKNDFFAIGGHSLLAATLITRIECEFGRRIDFATLSQAATIEHLGEILCRSEWSAPGASLVPIRASGNRPPLYCVHGLGGHIIPFLRLANHLGPDQPVYGLQAIAVDGNGNPERTLEEIAARYLGEIEEVQPSGPYYLAGFSFGGFAAYEMARQLAMRGKPVALLAILDTQAGTLSGFRRSMTTYKRFHFQARSLAERLSYRLSGLAGGYQRDGAPAATAPSDQQEVIMGEVREEEVPEHLMEIMKANRLALRNYVPKGYAGKITVFKSTHGQGINYGWDELTSGPVEYYAVPGTHRGILQEPSVAILTNQLRSCINKTLES